MDFCLDLSQIDLRGKAVIIHAGTSELHPRICCEATNDLLDKFGVTKEGVGEYLVYNQATALGRAAESQRMLLSGVPSRRLAQAPLRIPVLRPTKR